MKTFTVKIGKGPDEMTFDECMVHIKRVLFWDYIDGEWCDVVPLYDRRWDELAGYIRGAHEREVDALKADNAKLRELLLDVADVLGKNEKLRELADRLRSAASDGADNACDVLDESAKLRKLLLDVWNDAMQVDGFWDCAYDDGEICNEDELPHYQERMRELGVEVDE